MTALTPTRRDDVPGDSAARLPRRPDAHAQESIPTGSPVAPAAVRAAGKADVDVREASVRFVGGTFKLLSSERP